MKIMNEQFLKAYRSLKQSVIRYPQFNMAYRQIVSILELKKATGIAQHLLCIGAAGTGKSTLKSEIKKSYPEIRDTAILTIPVLTVDTPAIPTVKNVAESILLTLGDPLANKGTIANKTVRILSYLDACGVQLIIFDELQHFIDQGKKNTPYQVSDWLKNLVDNANIPTVLMGLERSEQILRVNEQLRRRFNQRICLKAFNLKDKLEYQTFSGIVVKLRDLHGYPMDFNIKSSEALERLHYATNGIIDYIVKIMLGAFEVAFREGQTTITQESFYKAFLQVIWHDAPDELNPFHQKFTWQSLTKLHMPFHVAGGYNESKS